MSVAYHPQTDGRCEKTLKTLEDMLITFWVDLVNECDTHLPRAEFSENNSYHSSIKYAPFEALYGQRCRSLISWTEVGDTQLSRMHIRYIELTGPEIIHEITKKIVQIKERLNLIHSR